MTDVIKSFSSVLIVKMTDDSNEEKIRVIVFENSFYTWQPETPVKQIVELLEIDATEIGSFDYSHFDIVEDVYGEIKIEEESKFNFGRAKKFSSKMRKAIEQITNEKEV